MKYKKPFLLFTSPSFLKLLVMNPWYCALIITSAGAIGGVVNALISDNGFILPRLKKGILCPGFMTNVLIGALSAFSSWSFYGSGASIELARVTGTRKDISLTFGAIAGAFLVGVAGAKWLTNEVDKKLLKESVKEAATKDLTVAECEKIIQQQPLKILEAIENA
jgi:hypothetical protein